MNLSLEGRFAVVTGASKGIGAGIAKTLAEAGATVVVNFSTDQKGADAVVSSIVAKGGKAIAVQGSVAKAVEVQHLFAVTKQEFWKARHPRQTMLESTRSLRLRIFKRTNSIASSTRTF